MATTLSLLNRFLISRNGALLQSLWGASAYECGQFADTAEQFSEAINAG